MMYETNLYFKLDCVEDKKSYIEDCGDLILDDYTIEDSDEIGKIEELGL